MGTPLIDRIERAIDNLDLILKEYYKMKKQKNILKITTIIIGSIIIFGYLFLLCLGYYNKYEITTDINNYQEIIGPDSKNKYKDQWRMSEEIFPKTIKNLNVLDFKMIYYDPFDKQYLSYLVVDYNEEEYNKEIERLNSYGIENYIGFYGVTGFTNYKLLAMESDVYQGFVYAITDGKSKIIYVEIIFCNYFMDIKYDEEIPKEYLPDNFDAKIDNNYRKKMMNEMYKNNILY